MQTGADEYVISLNGSVNKILLVCGKFVCKINCLQEVPSLRRRRHCKIIVETRQMERQRRRVMAKLRQMIESLKLLSKRTVIFRIDNEI
jgi:hypothetical protein